MPDLINVQFASNLSCWNVSIWSKVLKLAGPSCPDNEPSHIGMQVQGVRVEVNGQVLSQGGDTQADQIKDTSSTTISRSNGGFLPAAVIIGLIPGSPLQVYILLHAGLMHQMQQSARNHTTLKFCKGSQSISMLLFSLTPSEQQAQSSE